MTKGDATPRHARRRDRPRDDAPEGERLRLQATAERAPDSVPLRSVGDRVQVMEKRDADYSSVLRAVLAFFISGLGTLSAGVQGSDAGDITIAVWLTALAAAMAAAGAVFGVRATSVETRMEPEDTAALKMGRDS